MALVGIWRHRANSLPRTIQWCRPCSLFKVILECFRKIFQKSNQLSKSANDLSDLSMMLLYISNSFDFVTPSMVNIPESFLVQFFDHACAFFSSLHIWPKCFIASRILTSSSPPAKKRYRDIFFFDFIAATHQNRLMAYGSRFFPPICRGDQILFLIRLEAF